VDGRELMGVLFADGTDEEMLNITNLNALLKSSSDLLALIGHESPEDSGQSLVSAYNKAKSRLTKVNSLIRKKR